MQIKIQSSLWYLWSVCVTKLENFGGLGLFFTF